MHSAGGVVVEIYDSCFSLINSQTFILAQSPILLVRYEQLRVMFSYLITRFSLAGVEGEAAVELNDFSL